ncbi:M1 family metallopeptidase [Cyclobacterium jeungdonense]|uniref:Aminopeptidase N n=1 Tax=Cyclobacterium jeungdonense TaxID=708087 RepID=A0ABT8C6S8_9BACT|nr:M1 family metallopeptidase [Cyclobacterium jeungdonense]MDN3687435.1 M1 family aminopeptidase [Cyclobacterium jeungdonense]
MKHTFVLFFLIVVHSGLFAQMMDIYQRPVTLEPDRDFDALHYSIELDIDMDGKQLTGQNTVTLTPLRSDLNRVSLDAVSLLVSDVLDSKGFPLSYTQGEDKVHINLSRTYSYSDTLTFTIKYNLSDQVEGLKFIDETETNPMQVSSDCWPNKARQWIPCYDYPNDKVTQEMIVTVDNAYKVLSNGKLMHITEDQERGKHTYHWKQSLPHSTYLISLSIADYTVIEDSLDALPVNYWVYERHEKDAKRSFAKTPYMIDFFTRLYGYAYPWEKYDQVVSAHQGGGAEATTATLLGEGAVTTVEEAIDFSFEGILAHEVAHQWWGDLVTLRSWEHSWINESFATYSDYLYKRYDWGEDEAEYDLLRKKNAYLREANNRYMRPIVFNRYENPGQNFDSHAYPKGANVLHMLRFVLGDDTFFRVISQFLHQFEFQAVGTQDFMQCVQEVSGLNMDLFFEQFLFHPGHAVFEVSKNWDESTKTLTLEIKQTQDKWENVPIYTIPVNIGFYHKDGKRVEKVTLKERVGKFEFKFDTAPLMVRFDEGNHLLKEWTYLKTEEELLFQVENDDVPGRLWAIDQLKDFSSSPKTIQKWTDLARGDNFWAVREAAVQLLSEFHESNSKEVFLQAVSDSNSKVRAAAIKALGQLKDPSMISDFKRIYERDDSFLVRAEALIAIGANGNASHLRFLNEAAKVRSPRNTLKNAAEKSIELIRDSNQ